MDEVDSYDNYEKRRYVSRAEGKGKKQKINRNFGSENFEEIQGTGKGRDYTVSIAVPASILEETCLLDELRTYVVGQIARAANIYSIDEIIVYDDGCWRQTGSYNNNQEHMDMMRVLLEYQECPQYLRKHLFGFNPSLRKVGVLNALNSPHHLRSDQWCKYREGVVLERGNKDVSFADVGLEAEISIDLKLKPGMRVTVKIPPECQEMKRPYGIIVSPDEPRSKDGFYWGYTVRSANSLSEVLAGSRFPDGYDLLVGTSDKGDDIDDINFPKFSHALIMFGGVEGLESALEAEPKIETDDVRLLFDHYVNTCPLQQTRTIRTEEAVLISLCRLTGKLNK